MYDLVGLGKGLENLHFSQFLSAADAASTETLLWEPLH